MNIEASPAEHEADAPVVSEVGTGESADQISDNTEDTGAQPAADTPAAGKDDNKPESILDAVKSAMADKGEPPSNSEDQDNDTGSDAEDEAEGKTDAQDDADDAEVSPDELKSYKPKTRRRIEKLLGQRNEAQRKLEDVTPRAEQYEKIESFMKDSDLSHQDVANGFQMMRLMRKDPAKALEALRPMVQQLESLTGDALPEDLAKRVQTGHISREDALDLSRARASNEWTKQQSEAERQKGEQARRAEAQRQQLSTIQTTASSWENRWKESDPDYDVLAPMVLDKAKAFVADRRAQGTIPTTQEVSAALEGFRKEAKQTLTRMRGRKQEITPVRENGATRQTKPQPESYLDVVRQATAVGQS